MGGDERLEPEGPERSAGVGHDRDHRLGAAFVVDRGQVAQRSAGQMFGLGEGELDGELDE